MSKLVVNLVTWNGEKYISFLFDSLKKQTYKDWELKILDNGSHDNTILEIKKQIKDFPVEVELIKGKDNLGFAAGHNKLYKKNSSEYILLLNQDMYLEEDCLEKLVKFMDENRDASVVSPRLMRWDFVNKKFTNKIDTLGLKVLRSRRVTDIDTGKSWDECVKGGDPSASLAEPVLSDNRRVQDDFAEVFGVSGAMPMFRKVVVDEVGLFDEGFVSYKEDVDLAFRLRGAGYKAFVLLDAVAYHDRSAEGLEKKSDWFASKNKKKQSNWVRYHSYKNHLITLYKNEYWQNFLLDLPWVLWYELKKFGWFLLFDRGVLKGLKDIVKMKKEIKDKREKIKDLRLISWREIRVWFK